MNVAAHRARKVGMVVVLAGSLLAMLAPGMPAVAQGRGLPEVEANDTPDSAMPVVDAFEIDGNAMASDDWFAWRLDPGDGRWTVAIEGPPDQALAVDLFDADQRLLDRASALGGGLITDLALEAGDYLIRIPRTGEHSVPYVLAAMRQDEEFDPEPNDRSDPVPIEDGVPAIGRLGRTVGDRDLYALSVPADVPMLRDVRLTWPSKNDVQLCLTTTADELLKCHRGREGEVRILDLVLEPGRYLIRVDGPTDLAHPYTLSVDIAGPARTDHESEPNDEPATASAFDVSLGVSGRSDAQDPDTLRATISGETQLWRLVASGPSIDRLGWLLPDGSELGFGRADEPGADAVIEDLLLAPGDHYFRVQAHAGDYRVTATPLGPPDPDGEREPNSDRDRAEPYRVGQRRVGRLPTADDVDHYRFTAAAVEHIGVHLEQPPGADMRLLIETRAQPIVDTRASEPGAALDLDLLLQPGDYLVQVSTTTASDEPYVLTTERLDPFALAADQEPNGEMATAQPVPPTLRWTGSSTARVDRDWFALDPLSGPGPLRVTLDALDPTLRISDGSSFLEVAREEDGSFVVADPPLGTPLYLEITAAGPYEAAVAGPGLDAAPEPVDAQLELVLSVDVDEVAAYSPLRQRVEGHLELVSRASEDVALELEGVTSHYAWSVELEDRRPTVPAGGTVRVPFAIEVLPDAWANEPVRVSVRASTPDGGQVSGGLEMDATRDAPPVGSSTGFSVPEALLGGLNVASSGLGAVPGGTIDAALEPMLYDEVTPIGAGFFANLAVTPLPLELIVDLAGDVPVPVAGTIINPQAHPYPLGHMPAGFELLTSTDGASWTEVLAGEISPLPIDQVFVLDAPVPATHAMLRITSTHGDAPRNLTLGDWKVIAQPGVAAEPMPTDLADPTRGGHVVSFEPFHDDLAFGSRVLDEDPAREQVAVREDDDRFELVFGFHDDRAARLTGLGWRDPDGSDPSLRVERVDVEVSATSPLGPWHPSGTWSLVRAADGSVQPFAFDEPVWARFVRLSSPLPEAAEAWLELPADVDAYEMASGEAYRSILGEWGYTSSLGPYEWSMPIPTAEPIELGPDAADVSEDATPLRTGMTVTDSVTGAEDVDWFAIDVPAGQSTLDIEIQGLPMVDVRLTLFDADDRMVPTSVTRDPDGVERHRAAVRSADRYALRVEQLPLSSVLAFDTSDSMEPVMPFVREGMRAFTAGVEPGRDAVMALPFEEPPLLPTWQDQPTVLQDAVNNYVRALRSSGAESGLLGASSLLSGRDGRRAILILTDAETGSYRLTPDLWPILGEVGPVVFSVNVGARQNPARARDLMQDWAIANGGHYVNASTHAALDRAFERMSTWLRRPAIYRLSASTSDLALASPTLAVEPASGTGGSSPSISIVLDTSGSMRKGIAGRRRIQVAKEALDRLVREALPEDVDVALRTFGGKGKGNAARCKVVLAQPLAPLQRAELLERIDRIKAAKRTKTPLAASVLAAAADVDPESGGIILLVTDGAETCEGDPAAVADGLRAQGTDVRLNIVGFALDDEELKEEMASWARSGDGAFFDAASPEELTAAITAAVSPSFEVRDADGAVVGRGTVGGDPIEVPPGVYRVEVGDEASTTFEDVVVPPESPVRLAVPGS